VGRSDGEASISVCSGYSSFRIFEGERQRELTKQTMRRLSTHTQIQHTDTTHTHLHCICRDILCTGKRESSFWGGCCTGVGSLPVLFILLGVGRRIFRGLLHCHITHTHAHTYPHSSTHRGWGSKITVTAENITGKSHDTHAYT